LKFPPPAYVAVIVRFPRFVSAKEHVPARIVPVHVSVPPLIVTTTSPAGVPPPGATTVKVTVTIPPYTDASGLSDVIVVTVGPGVIWNVTCVATLAE
jgi:hypothetical protein